MDKRGKGEFGMISQEQYMLELYGKGKRVDGRAFDELRQISAQTNVIEKAEGSALVKWGQTQVIAGVKMETKTPFPDAMNEGILMVGAEFSPIASPAFEHGPPNENAVELARVVDRSVRESHAVDFEKLCIVEGEKVWNVMVDIHIVDDGGNLIDASALAAMAALLHARMPKYEDDKIVYAEKTNKKLPIKWKPVAITHVKIGNNLLIDPITEEEVVASARFTVGTKDDENICAIQKGGAGGFTMAEIETMMKTSIEKGKQIRKLLVD